MPRPEHPHIEEVKGWIADDFRENEGPKSGTAYHDKAVALWGVKDAPALRTVANALRDVREATRLGKRENNAMSYWLKEEPAPPKPVESESLTAGECPECLGYGHFWRGIFFMRGDSQVWKPTALSHGGPLTARELGELRDSGSLFEATASGEQVDKVTCGTCVGTGYIGTPATRTPVWEQPEEEALATAQKKCPECLGEIWDDECQCPVEDIPIATGVVESKDREVAEADATIQNLVEMVNDNPKLKSVADTLATEIADQIIEGNNQDLAINFKDIALPDFTTREDQ